MSKSILPQPHETFSKSTIPEKTKPSITISISIPSHTLSLSNTKDPFIISLTVKVSHHKCITAHSYDNILSAVPAHGKGVEDFLDFVSLTPLHDDVFAPDPLDKKAKDEKKDKINEENPIFLRWANYLDFNHLFPTYPSVFGLTLGPWRVDPKLPDPPRQKDEHGRWIWDGPIVPVTETWDWGIIKDLEEGVEYEIRLKEGTYVKWWTEGPRDDHLAIYAEHSNWVLGKLLGRVFEPWKGSPVMDESEWIELVVEGEMPTIKVVA